MENKEWLNDLKVGDKVVVVMETAHYIDRQIKIITAISNGIIEVGDDGFKSGKFINNNILIVGYMYLQECTKELEEQIRNKLFVKTVLQKLKEDITFEQAQQINNILNLGVEYETIND